LELQSHITAAVASETAQIKTNGNEILELVSFISQKVTDWEEQGIQGAASLARGIRTVALNFTKNLTTENPAREESRQPRHCERNSYAEAT